MSIQNFRLASKQGKQIFARIKKQLEAAGTYDDMTAEVVADYAKLCELESKLYDAMDGETEEVMLASKAWREVMVLKNRLQRELGFSPTTRAKAAQAKGKKGENPWGSV